jgi:hypothetical protein
VRALRSAGNVVRLAVMSRPGDADRSGAPVADQERDGAAELRVDDDPRGRAAVAAFVAANAIDTVYVASATTGPALDLPRTVDLVRWPTGASSAFVFGGRRAVPLRAPAADDPAPWIGWNALDSTARASALPIWDGDYLLCPTALPGRAGAAAIDAFTSIAHAWSGIELVILSDVDPRLVERARRLGVGPRIHFVGPAERSAEWAWWAHAAAGWLPAEVPVSGGLVLRALACGCPLVAARDVEPGRSIARWLAERGLAPAEDGAAAALNALLERGPAVERIVANGRETARRHDAEALAARLAGALAAAGRESGAVRAARRAA